MFPDDDEDTCEVETVADQGAPAKEIGQAQPPGHVMTMMMMTTITIIMVVIRQSHLCDDNDDDDHHYHHYGCNQGKQPL